METKRPIERGVQRVVGGFVAFYTINACIAFAPKIDKGLPWSAALVVVSLSLALTLALRGWGGALSRVDVGLGLILIPATLTLNHLWHAAGIGDTGGPGYAGISITLFVEVVALAPRRFLIVGLGTVAYYAAGRGLSLGHRGFTDGLDEGISHLGFMSAFAITLLILRHADRQADAALATELRANAERVAVQATEVALRESQRILHDDVIAALITIELRRESDDGVSVRAAAARAREAFMPRTVPSPSLAPGSLVHPLSIAVDFEADDAVDPYTFPPPQVSGAMVLATMEALRNVERHAGVTRARVHRQTGADGSITMTIEDRGAGFDAHGHRGFGLKHGIAERIRDVGGMCRISSAPGQGTIVRLSWSPTPSVGSDTRSVTLTRELHRQAPLIATVGILGQVWLAVRHAWASPHTGPLLATAVISVAISLLLAFDVRRSDVSTAAARWRAISAYAVQLGLLAYSQHLIGMASLPTFDCWMVEFVEISLIVIGLAFPTPYGLISGALTTAGLWVASAVSPAVTVGASSATLTEPVLVAAGATAIAASVRRAQRAILERQRSALETGWATGTMLATNRELSERLEGLRGSILPFLDDVIAEHIDIADPEIRARARLLELEARDELYLHELLDDDLRSLLREARVNGCEITIRSSDAILSGRTAALVLRSALDPAHTSRAVMVLPRANAPEMRLRMSPPLTHERVLDLTEKLAELRPDIASDAETTTVSVRFSDQVGLSR